MNRQIPLLIALASVIVGPIALRPKQDSATRAADQTLVIITPHNESIRYEFGRAFAEHYEKKTGKRLRVDFRTPGGTSEIARYIESEYVASFQHYWTKTLGNKWSTEVQAAFIDSTVKVDGPPEADTPAQAARRAFLASQLGCKIDLFFGGGSYDFQLAASKGFLVSSGFVAENSETLGEGEGKVPAMLSGEPFFDPQSLWIGNVISSFGIVYNSDVLTRLQIAEPPRRWSDLANPRYAGEIALANPTQSGSINKAFEMVVQQEIADEMFVHSAADDNKDVIAAGWLRALRLLQRIGANARYFTDSSTKPSLDVATGDCAAGMTIDFYGRFQSEAVTRSGGNYLHYVNAESGTSITVDPIGLFRGAPRPELAREFIAFVMSADGQKLWNWKVHAPGGPQRYALRRMPILPSLYADEFKSLRSDPDVYPYEMAKEFRYRPGWTAGIFGAQAFIIRAMCIDSHDELKAAWRALIDAGFPPRAMEKFADVDHVNYAAASGRIKATASSKAPKIDQVRLAKALADQFRANYLEAARLARLGQ
jgi:ABC-type Fe3+ transport system substrate-binding protein